MKKLWWILLSLVFAGMAALGVATWYLFAPNMGLADKGQPYYLYISRNDHMEDIVAQLKADKVIRSPHTFTTVARLSESEERIRPGRYRIAEGMSNYRMLQKLRNGLQDPVKFTFNNINFISDFCGVAGRSFDFDSIQMAEAMHDQGLLDSLGIRREMLLGHLLPNTYEVYWTTTPEGLLRRLVKESGKFWDGEREALLEQSGLTKDQVLIIASITQKETNHRDEMPRIAGVYINRLRTGMKLQADPTVKYALGDLGLRRVLFSHLEYPSPYNTYYAEGLPPGVICAPNPSTIDQVLRFEKHGYLYFCARPGYNSKHAFAVTHHQHLQNRAKYQAWLRSENIR